VNVPTIDQLFNPSFPADVSNRVGIRFYRWSLGSARTFSDHDDVSLVFFFREEGFAYFFPFLSRRSRAGKLG